MQYQKINEIKKNEYLLDKDNFYVDFLIKSFEKKKYNKKCTFTWS